MEKSCTECGLPVYGRADKRFCSDHCRNAWHNKQGRDDKSLIRSINNVLNRNRKILKELNVNYKHKRVNEDDLQKAGFNLNYYTNVFRTKSGKTYYFCYDHGYSKLPNKQYMVVKRKDYVK